MARAVYLKCEDTLMSEWGASDGSPSGTVWSEYLDGWESRRVERWGDRWLFVREPRSLDTCNWSEESLAELITCPEVNACNASEFEAAWATAWEHGFEDTGTHLHGDHAALLAIDPVHSPHRKSD